MSRDGVIVNPPLSKEISYSRVILHCGPASLVQAVINEHAAKLVVCTGASMTIVKQSFQHTYMPNVPLHPGSMDATSLTGGPVTLRFFSASHRIGSNVAFQDFYVVSGF